MNPSEDPKLRRQKKWMVIYGHCHGDIGFTGLLTYKQAAKERDKLLENRQYLDFFKIVYCPGGPLHEL